jgi:uncharacterized membrane protein
MAKQMEIRRREGSKTYRNGGTERLANALGWFSIGLGIAEIAAPEALSKLVGMKADGRRGMVRLYGLREIASGVGILSAAKPSFWLWGRVAGDLLDIASLASVMRSNELNRTRLALTTAAVLGVTVLDVYCGRQLRRRPSPHENICVTKTIIVNRSPEELYAFWHRFESFPMFIDRLESIEVTGERRSHWKAKALAGTTVEWESEIVNDQPNRLISWHSVEGSEIENSGSVSFDRAAGGRGTIVRLELEYIPIGGRIGVNFARLFGAEPGQQVESALRRMKQILETGSIVRSDASIHRVMHPARPQEKFKEDSISADRNAGAAASWPSTSQP